MAWLAVLLVVAAAARPAASPRPPASLAVTSIRVEPGRMPAEIETAESGASERLARVVAVLSGSRAEVWCWTPSDWEEQVANGVVPPNATLGPWSGGTHPASQSIHLASEVCVELAKLVDHRGSLVTYESLDAAAWSVGVLAHEAQHVAGVRDEAVADCYALQTVARAARLLGRAARESRYLAALNWKRWYVWDPDHDRLRECRNRGGLDLRPAVDAWP